MNESTPPNFYIVPTPIGNLKDITLRAIEVLGSVDIILCEDTRVTGQLLKHLELKNDGRLLAYHEHTSKSIYEKVKQILIDGKTVALVTDAGTPGISDPGEKLLAYLYEELADTIEPLRVSPLPGANACTTLLSASGLDTNTYTFIGFLPTKKGRKTSLESIHENKHTVVLYESPHRIMKLLNELSSLFAESNRRIVLGRELTKMYEQILRGTPKDILVYFTEHPEKIRGEFTIIIEGAE